VTVPTAGSPVPGPVGPGSPSLLEVRDVSKRFGGGLFKKRYMTALDGFSMTVSADRATITAIAGESGSGKTTLARLILGMLAPSRGQILFKGRDLGQMSARGRREFRREVQAIFQDPYEVYNPFYRVDHVLDMVISNFGLAPGGREAERMKREAVEVVGLRPDDVLGRFPHELSGGQRQRVMVARAFLARPRLIVADEPVSMVDASLRALILEVMLRLRNEYGISFVYITHDLSTAFQLADDIYVLYQGAVAEMGAVAGPIQEPKHPYTQLLVGSIPLPDPDDRWQGRVDLPPDDRWTSAEAGCRYRARCPFAMPVCAEAPPPLYDVGPRHRASCYLYAQDSAGAAPAGGSTGVSAPVGVPSPSGRGPG
jgi:peptide/nickel transport system ATP-binding protein